MALEIRRLLPEDDRSGFRSGDLELDRFFVRYAGQNQFRHHLGTTYVAAEDGTIHGFVTLAAADLEVVGLPARLRKGLPAYPLPALRIARLAVDHRSARRGIGTLLLKTAFGLALELAEKVGCVGVVVDAKPDAVPFYGGFGFEEIDVRRGALGERPRPTPMFLAIGVIARA